MQDLCTLSVCCRFVLQYISSVRQSFPDIILRVNYLIHCNNPGTEYVINDDDDDDDDLLTLYHLCVYVN